jgi:predicted restriction endonuclease
MKRTTLRKHPYFLTDRSYQYNSTLKRSTKPLKRTPLKATAKALRIKTYKPIRQVSTKQKLKEASFHKLVNYLIINRAKGVCEVKGKECRKVAVQGCHIIPRSQGRIDTAGNVLVACSGDFCHNHHLFNRGLPFLTEEAQKRATEANKRCGISDDLRGEDLS